MEAKAGLTTEHTEYTEGWRMAQERTVGTEGCRSRGRMTERGKRLAGTRALQRSWRGGSRKGPQGRGPPP
jgi:hypothetical protein